MSRLKNGLGPWTLTLAGCFVAIVGATTALCLQIARSSDVTSLAISLPGLILGALCGLALWLVTSLAWRALTPHSDADLAGILRRDALSFAAVALPLQSLRYFVPAGLASTSALGDIENGFASKLQPGVVLPVYIILTVLLFVALKLVFAARRPTVKLPTWSVLGLLAVYVVAAAAVHHVAHGNYTPKEPVSAVFVNAFNNLYREGSFFFTRLEGGSHLGVHGTYLMFPLYPLFRLLGGQLFVELTAPLCLAGGAYLLYLLGKERLGDLASFVLMLVFLAYPTLAWQAVGEYAELLWAVPLLLGAVYAFEKERFGWFVACLALAVLVKENIPLAVALFGLYALLRRRSWPWVVAPLALGVGWFVVTTRFLIPWAANGLQYGFLSRRYAHLGATDSAAGSLKYFIAHPEVVIKYLLSVQPAKTILDALVGTGLGIALLLSPVGWIACEPLLEVCLGASPYLADYHMALVPIFLFAGLALGLTAWAKRAERHLSAPQIRKAVLALLVVLLFLNVGYFHLWVTPEHFGGAPNQPGLQKILAQIPPDASARVPDGFCFYQAGRADLYSYNWYGYGDAHNIDYVMVTSEWLRHGEMEFPAQAEIDGASFNLVSQEWPYALYVNPEREAVR